MCGIAGFIGSGEKSDAERMIAALKHRGPDYQGVFFEEGIGLAHARLSILDLSEAGNQPMFDKTKKLAITFNGEIYNFRELKRELEDLGYSFRSSSDTEVILNLYKEFGERCFERLNGMFAIGLYDFTEKKLILVRDRMGQKPLYWGEFDGSFIFASELKAVKAHPSFQEELDLNSLSKYLSFEYVPSPYTIYKNLKKLEPATYLVFQHGKIRKEIYWKLNFDSLDIPFKTAKNYLYEHLDVSVKRRMVSDVPLGVFLSGGLDSSAIAYFAQKNSNTPVNTFSIGFEDESFDESKYAQKVADYLGTNHHNKILSAQDVLDFIPHIADILDEPLADASIIPTYLLSRFAKNELTVALGGDGGDELFAGYPTFQADILARYYKKIPKQIRQKFIEKTVNNLSVSDKNFSLEYKLKKFIEGFDGEDAYRHQRWLGSFSRGEKKELFKPEVWAQVKTENEFSLIDDYLEEHQIEDDREKALMLYMRTYLMDQVLVKVDRASMKTGLEVRAPFLDHHLVDFVNSLPYEFKQKGFTTKYILKHAMKGKLPNEIIFRKKKGFGIPLARWLKNELKDLCEETLSEERTKEAGFFNYDFIKQLKEEHFSGRKDNRKKLWTLMVFEFWRA